MRIFTAGVVSTILLGVALLFTCALPKINAAGNRIRVEPNQAARRVDIFIDGKPFTSYIWPTSLAKPVLYPLRTATGVVVTRGYPLEPRPGERTDHPHHAGLWFNYGSVNGIDFWNNSDAIKPEDQHKMGTVVQRRIVAAKSESEQGELEVETDWNTADQKMLLKEHTRLVFRGGPKFRSIDRITTLQAQNEKVVFEDDKEGLMGIRVARALEMPSDKPEIFLDASGHPTTVAKLDNTGVNGTYLTSEGKTGDAAWGTLVQLERDRGRPACDDHHIRQPGEPEFSGLLACARLRAVCRESAGAKDLHQRKTGGAEFFLGAWTERHVSISGVDFFGDCHRRRKRGGLSALRRRGSLRPRRLRDRMQWCYHVRVLRRRCI
jgi:Methane oxygenase PmoA